MMVLQYTCPITPEALVSPKNYVSLCQKRLGCRFLFLEYVPLGSLESTQPIYFMLSILGKMCSLAKVFDRKVLFLRYSSKVI